MDVNKQNIYSFDEYRELYKKRHRIDFMVVDEDREFLFGVNISDSNIYHPIAVLIIYKDADKVKDYLILHPDIFTVEDSSLAKIACARLEENDRVPRDMYKALATRAALCSYYDLDSEYNVNRTIEAKGVMNPSLDA